MKTHKKCTAERSMKINKTSKGKIKHARENHT